jgi:MFS transporter, DHA3 family, macrolide efflux protein
LGFLNNQSPLIIGLFFAFIGGIGTGITLTAVNYMIQKEPPTEAIGRVSGIVDSMLSILFIAGPLLGGVLIQQLGVILVFRGIGVVLFFTGMVGIIFQQVIWKKNEPFTIDSVSDAKRQLKKEVN